MPKVGFDDFADSLGTTSEDISRKCGHIINGVDFDYEIIDGDSRDHVILEVLMKIEADRQTIGAKERQETWNNGWGENLKDFIDSGYDLKMLVPRFIKPNKIMRYKQNYIRSVNKDFEFNYYNVFREWIFMTYFKDFRNIYEFGCGTGFNLVALSKLYPDKNLYGTDFVQSSVDLVNKIGQAHNLRLKGNIFDMINPTESFKIQENSLIFTIGSIEQLAGKFEDFLQYLLRNRPGLCVHSEPIIELYDNDNLLDYLAVKFHQKRGYTQGFLSRLQELEKEGRIEIIKVKRLFFGNLFMDGYNLLVWRILK
ncbi:MAG: class I SAM-dependent methyltransferase [Candidatus Omnitrophica bacterium]|jgi:SAM-dependent methyltransferase|nr:class I SAM-dependent methyltransferase [Candidatus Omnitrophota bacterium]